MRRACLPFALVLALLAPAGAGSAADGGSSRAGVGDALRRALERADHARIVVALRPAAVAASGPRTVREALLDRVVGRGFRPTTRWDAVAAVPGIVTAAGVEALARDPAVLRVDLDVGGAGATAESVPLVRADVARAAGVTGRGITVAVIDSGVEASHPDLSDALVAERCFVLPSGCPNGAPEQAGAGSAVDDHGHGTNVSGVVLGNGSVAPPGVAPDASLVAVKVLDRGNRFQSTAQIVSALDWIALERPDVRVVNMSLGTFQLFPGNCDTATSWTMALASAVAALRARGVSLFASAGNEGNAGGMGAPSCISGVVAVGAVYDANVGPFAFGSTCANAVTAPDTIACFSNSGSELDLLAPGALVTSAGRGSSTSTFAGTSQASPHAAGAAALLVQRTPSLPPDAVEGALESTGIPIADPRNGLTRPRLDVAAALALPQEVSAAALGLGRRSLAFGGVRIGRQRTLAVPVTNRGTAPLSVRATASRPFSVLSAQPLVVPPGGTGVVRVLFAPRLRGQVSRTLVLRSNDPDAPRSTVALRGTGLRR